MWVVMGPGQVGFRGLTDEGSRSRVEKASGIQGLGLGEFRGSRTWLSPDPRILGFVAGGVSSSKSLKPDIEQAW